MKVKHNTTWKREIKIQIRASFDFYVNEFLFLFPFLLSI